MTKGLHIAVTLLVMTAIVSLWLWGAVSLFRRRNRTYSERDMVGGTVRTVRSGPMFGASWTPTTGPAYLFTAVMYGIGYIAFLLFGFHPALITAFTVIAAVMYINQMRRKIGLGNPYARAATAVYLATITIAFLGVIFRWRV